MDLTRIELCVVWTEEVFSWLAGDSGLNVHLGLFVLLLLGGLGFPIPEDIPLFLGGVAAGQGIITFHGAFITCYLGVVTADQMVFLIGFLFGPKLLNAGERSTLFPAITRERVDEVREGLRKRKLLYIFVARHLFPIRTVTFLTAGALRMPYWEFFVADALAALVSVSLLVSLGWWLGDKLDAQTVSHAAHNIHWWGTGLLLFVIAYYFLRRKFLSRKRIRV